MPANIGDSGLTYDPDWGREKQRRAEKAVLEREKERRADLFLRR